MYKQYQQPDPFYYQGTLSQLVSTQSVEGEQLWELNYQCKPTFLDYVDIPPMRDFLLGSIKIYAFVNGLENSVYFYHGDHLGSASWITDVHGDPVQYIHYAPYGELLASQHAYGSSYDERQVHRQRARHGVWV